METAHLIFQVLNIHAPDEVAGWTNDIQLDLTREPPGYTTWAGNYFDNVTVVTWAVDVAVQLKDTANETLLMLDAGGQVSRSNVPTFRRFNAPRSTLADQRHPLTLTGSGGWCILYATSSRFALFPQRCRFCTRRPPIRPVDCAPPSRLCSVRGLLKR